MKRISTLSTLAASLFVIFLSMQTVPCLAANHPMSGYTYDAGADRGYLDMVMTVDWEPDASDRTNLIEAMIEGAAGRIFDATEGQHHIRNVFVFTNDIDKDRCDLYLTDGPGRGSGYSSGYGTEGGRINFFTQTPAGLDRSAASLGGTMAHEFGHYAYGLLDEYQEAVSMDFDDYVHMPHTTDDNCPCHMGNYKTTGIIDYCLLDNHKEMTAQERVYEASCWEVLSRNPDDDPDDVNYLVQRPRIFFADFDYPDGGVATQAGGLDDLNIVFVDKAGVQIVLLIDQSGSMADDLKIDFARAGGGVFTDLMQIGDTLGVYGFNSSANAVVDPMTGISSAPPQNDIKPLIYGLNADGGTAIGAALAKALALLTDDPSINTEWRRGVILLSDGQNTVGLEPQSLTALYFANDIPIYTVGIGEDTDVQTLQALADGTGGQFFFGGGPENLQDIYEHLSQEIGINEELVDAGDDEFDGKARANESRRYPVYIDGTASQASFVASWAYGNAYQINLVTPEGKVITPQTAGDIKNVAYADEETYALYRVYGVDTGEWMIEAIPLKIQPGSRLHYHVQAKADIHLEVETEDYSVSSPQPIPILATLQRSLPVVNAIVNAVVTAPDGSQTFIKLQDDGEEPDQTPFDGMYSGVLTDYEMSGFYDIFVMATNPDGRAFETDDFMPHGPYYGADSAVARQALLVSKEKVPIQEPFTRADRMMVEVRDYKTDDHGDVPGKGTHVPGNNSPVWGHIERAGDVDFFQFALPAKSRCTIRAGRYLEGMQAALALLDAKGNVVAEGKDDKHGAFIEWSTQESMDMALRVEHSKKGTGYYQIKVKGEPVDEGPDDGPDDGPGGTPLQCTQSSIGGPHAGAGGDRVVFSGLVALLILLGAHRRSVAA